MYYIHYPNKHTEEAVKLALAELRHRNVTLPENVEETIDSQLKKKEELKLNERAWDKRMVNDEQAPLLYSQKSIYIFSILFSVLFGSFMLAENLRVFRKARWPVILFGLAYSIAIILLFNYLPKGLGYTYIANTLGVVIMHALFWTRFIGKETTYKAKPIWKPLIFGIFLFALTVAFLVFSNK